MILIFGGAYQGKLAYALERFKLNKGDVYECSIDDDVMPENKKIIYEIDKWLLALVKRDINVEDKMKEFINCSRDKVVICNDISCGVVPVDPVQRKWREETGRSLSMLSGVSEEVIRLFCGIPSRIK